MIDRRTNPFFFQMQNRLNLFLTQWLSDCYERKSNMQANLRFQALQSASSYRVIRVKLSCNLTHFTS